MKHVLSIACLIACIALGAVDAAAQHKAAAPAAAKSTPSAARKSPLDVGPDFEKEPTYIKSDKLTLQTDKRVFNYSGNVEVKQGEMTITAQNLEGTYSEKNEIQQLVATGSVVITRGDTMRGTCERAVYEAKTDSVTLTENPELQQEGSILSADVIRMFIKENRSTAEGEVRVKLVQQGKTQVPTL